MQTYSLCLEVLQFRLKRQIRTWSGIWTSDLQIYSLALYYLSYPGSIDGTGHCLQEGDLDMYRQLKQDSPCGRAPGKRSGGPSFKSRSRFEFFSWIHIIFNVFWIHRIINDTLSFPIYIMHQSIIINNMINFSIRFIPCTSNDFISFSQSFPTI